MADTTIDSSVQTILHLRNVRVGPVWIDESTGYVIYVDSTGDPSWSKTVNGGANWSAATVIHAGTTTRLSIWYDRWTTGDTGTRIHVAYNDTGTHDIFYRDLDTNGDSLGTERTVFSGVDFSVGQWHEAVVDITKARGGNLYIAFWGDGAGEYGFYRSVDNGVNWGARSDVADGNEADGILLMPGAEADDQDIWCIYWDRSADEISLKVYDDSGNSWGETLISAGMVADNSYYQISAAQRHSDNHVFLAAWSEIDAATADLKTWDIGGSASIVAKTDVLTDTAEAAQAAVLINQQNDDIYVAYLKGANWGDTVDVHYKKSDDGGANWGAEQDYSEGANDDFRAVWAGISVGDAGGKFQPAWFDDDFNDLLCNLTNDVDIAAAAGPPTGQPTMIRTQNIPTGPRDRPGSWN